MTQIISTNIRTALIEGSESGKAVNYAHDFTDLLGNVQNVRGFFQTLESNLTPTADGDNLNVAAGVAFVKYNKTSGEVGFLKFNLTSAQSIDLSTEPDGGYHCFIELDGTKVDNGSQQIDGSDVATLKVASSLPVSGDYLEICSLVKSGTTLTITDSREMIKLSMDEIILGEQKIPHAKIHEFGLRYGADSLSVTVNGGVYKEDGSSLSDTNLTLTASTTNYIELNVSTGIISSNTTGFSSIALYEVVTGTTGVTSVTDKRQAFVGSEGGGQVATTAEAIAGTDDTKFMSPLKTKQAISAGNYEFSGTTTDATETEIFLGGENNNRLTLPANSVLNFQMLVTGRSSSDVITTNIQGVVRRDDANNTSFLMEPEIKYDGIALGTPINPSYANKFFYVGSQETYPQHMAFGSSGSVMYVLGTNKVVYQYNLGTAWDVSTATYASKLCNVSGVDSSTQGLCFSANGTKMYITGNANDYIYQYGLGTAWDVSTATFESKSLSVSGQDNSPLGGAISKDGKTFICYGSTNKKLLQYNLGTAWDISTGAYAGSYDVSAISPQNIIVAQDGKTIFLINQSADKAYHYNLDTAWDLNGIRPSNKFVEVGTQDDLPQGGFVSEDKNHLYVLGTYNDKVHQYALRDKNWAIAVEADDTNEALTLKVKGADSTNITWQAKMFADLNQG